MLWHTSLLDWPGLRLGLFFSRSRERLRRICVPDRVVFPDTRVSKAPSQRRGKGAAMRTLNWPGLAPGLFG
jgi:hypothetical protein